MEGFEDASWLMEDICGVYLLLLKGQVVYVGKSEFVPLRVRQHSQSRKICFDQVLVHYCEWADMDWIELGLIRKYNPAHNQRSNTKRPLLRPAERQPKPVSLASIGLNVVLMPTKKG